MIVRDDALALRRAHEGDLRAIDEGAHLVLRARPGHALADEHERVLGLLEQVQRRLDIFLRRYHARRLGHAPDLRGLVEVALALDDVVGHVEVAGARTAIDRMTGGHLDVVGNARHALDAVRELAERRGDMHLALLLEGAHAAAIGLRGATDQDHRPAVLLCVGETGETVHDAWAGHRDARAGPARQIAVGPGRVGGGLLVAHADIGDAFFLRRCGDRADRKADNPEQVIDALLLEAPGHQCSAVDFAHTFLHRTE